MDKQRLLYLLNRQQDGGLTGGESRELDRWYNGLNHPLSSADGQDPDKHDQAEILLREFRQTRVPEPPRMVPFAARRFLRIAAIVTGVCLMAGAFVFFQNRQSGEKIALQPKPAEHNKKQQEFLPGNNQAILTLADGSNIRLDSAVNGFLAEQGNTRVTKLAGGRLVYDMVNGRSKASLFNCVRTPRGGVYQLMLPDGTGVWLNSASSIRYPVSFNGKIRRVEISGEAYFEVAGARSATGERIPFQVVMNDGEEIDVLGTHFNVNAYPDEGSVKTTLLEGAVRMNKGIQSIVIRPGQQADFTDKGYRLTEAEVEKVMAWKTGFFDFDNLDLPAILRQVSRWYDVDVVFDGKPRPIRFGGRISRNLPLSQILKMFEMNGVAFRMDGRILHAGF